MKVVLFAAGLGTRIRDVSQSIPKPMIPVGGQPILVHLMDYYSRHGHRDFVLCLGYKANIVKEYFLNFRPEMCSDLVVSLPERRFEVLGTPQDPWKITLIDTGQFRNIGQRLRAVREHVENEDMFLANYSDGLTDLNLTEMVDQFRRSDKVGCFMAVKPPLSYHFADIDVDGRVRALNSISQADLWINAGFFVFRPEIFDYLHEGDELVIEPFQRLIEADLLMAYKYEGFWRGMDTLRDHQILEDMSEKGDMPWRVERQLPELDRV